MLCNYYISKTDQDEFPFYPSQASDGLYSSVCNVNVTIRDVNNHSPQFTRDNYLASIAENTPIGNVSQFTALILVPESVSAYVIFRIKAHRMAYRPHGTAFKHMVGLATAMLCVMVLVTHAITLFVAKHSATHKVTSQFRVCICNELNA